MFLNGFILFFFLVVPPLFGAPSYLYLFESSKVRAVAGLERQKARLQLSAAKFDRASRLLDKQALSREEFEKAQATFKLADLDLQIAKLIVKQASISLDLARSLARNGRRIPLCRRKKQSDENTASHLLKRRKATPVPFILVEERRGTKLVLEPRVPPVEPPPRVNPPNVSPPKPPVPVKPPKPPDPPDIEFDSLPGLGF